MNGEYFKFQLTKDLEVITSIKDLKVTCYYGDEYSRNRGLLYYIAIGLKKLGFTEVDMQPLSESVFQNIKTHPTTHFTNTTLLQDYLCNYKM